MAAIVDNSYVTMTDTVQHSYDDSHVTRTDILQVQTQFKLCVGEVESIVQAIADDKAASPGAWRSWRYGGILFIVLGMTV